MIELFLDYPPTVNNYYVKTARGVYISSKGRKFREQAAESINKQLGFSHSELPTNEKLAVTVVLYPKDKRKRDLDNYMKGLLDAITNSGMVWADDSQIDQLFIYRGEKIAPNGLAYININMEPGIVIPVGMHEIAL